MKSYMKSLIQWVGNQGYLAGVSSASHNGRGSEVNLVRLTDHDSEILGSLARKVRAFTIDQLARGWWSHTDLSGTLARRRMTRLADAGYVKRMLVHASPPLALSGPLAVWSEGQPTPDFGSLAWKLQSRWPSRAPQPTDVVLAAKAANDMFGGPTTRPRFSSHHATHDLHVSDIYLIYRATRPDDAARWLGEDIREKSGYRLKDPDVLIDRDDCCRPLVVEFGGRSYDATHLRTFHEDCESRGRDYELW